MMKYLIPFAFVLFISGNCRSERIEELVRAIDPDQPVRFEQSYSCTTENLLDGEKMEFSGTSGTPFFTPQPEDFLLEKITDGDPQRVPMIFGFDGDDHRDEFGYPAESTARRLNLELRTLYHNPYRSAKMMEKLMNAGPVFDFHVDAALEPGCRYRLTWMCRPDGVRMTETKCVEFQISEAEPQDREQIQVPLGKQHYLLEILHRDKNTGVLFLSEQVLPDYRGGFAQTPTIGFSGGESIDPPTPGLRKIQDLLRELERIESASFPRKKLPPAAKTTNYFGGAMRWKSRDSEGYVQIHVSDLATHIRTPSESKPAYKLMGKTKFKIRKLEGNYTRLRQDEEYWKSRTSALEKEFEEAERMKRAQ